EAALTALRGEWTQARAGARTLVLVTGDPGIGKSRVAAEVARTAFADGATVLYGRTQEDPLAPYQPVAEARRPSVAACPPEQLEAHVGALAPELGRLVPDRRLPAPSDLATRDPAGARYRLFEAATALVGTAAGARPVLLVLDDLHWADRPTVALVRHLGCAHVGPLPGLGT